MAGKVLGFCVFLCVLLLLVGRGQGVDVVDILLNTEQGVDYGAVGPINPSFAGFSVEWSIDHLFMPYAQAGHYNLTLQLFRNLLETTGAAPTLRIGGNSADETWWQPPGARPPAWAKHDIGSPSELIKQLAKFFDELGGGEGKLVMDLNFREGTDPVLALNEIKYLADQFGAARWARHVKALEIGNEVDLYAGAAAYRNQSTWTTALYNEQWNQFAETIARAVQGAVGHQVKFQGATFCCRKDWFQFLPKFIDLNAERLATVSVHSYALSVCGGKNVSLAELVSQKLSPDGPQLDGLGVARARGIEYWLAETNSVSCGGAHGVSDAFGAGLWAIDWLFNGAALGYRGMNFHGAGSGAAYAPWSYGAGGVPKVHPLYYAMLAFARTIGRGAAAYILPAGSRLLDVKSTQHQLSVWSVGHRESGVRKVIVNHRDIAPGAANASVTVRLTHGAWHAEAGLTVFEAPSAYATDGVRLGGQTFDGSPDGRIRGTAQVVRVVAKAHNEWRFEMRPGSTAFLTVCPPNQPQLCYQS